MPGAVLTKRSVLKQQAILTTKKSKKVRLHEEIRKLDTKNIVPSVGKSDVGAKI